MIKRVHNSREPITIDKEYEYPRDDDRNDLKPRGLWYGINDGWINWCKENMPNWIGKYNIPIRLKKSARILTLDGKHPTKILSFVHKYSTEEIPFAMNWQEVKKDYDVLEIINYESAFHLRYAFGTKLLWYYAWDCDSGVIMNLKALS